MPVDMPGTMCHIVFIREGDRQMTIKFTTTAGQRIEGELVQDMGHAIMVRVTKGRKLYVGRIMGFPKSSIAKVGA
jgi:hypothetical protein